MYVRAWLLGCSPSPPQPRKKKHPDGCWLLPPSTAPKSDFLIHDELPNGDTGRRRPSRDGSNATWLLVSPFKRPLRLLAPVSPADDDCFSPSPEAIPADDRPSRQHSSTTIQTLRPCLFACIEIDLIDCVPLAIYIFFIGDISIPLAPPPTRLLYPEL